jgi:hypothetical protein
MNDVKGTPVQVDSLVEGFVGFTDKAARGRVYFVSPFGWVAAIASGEQVIMHEARYLVREGPRPLSQRRDIPERLQR